MSRYQNDKQDTSFHTLTTLNRWSVANKQLPALSEIKSLHVYDFDNTLFNSPHPNPKIWSGPTIGFLQSQDAFSTGGWWHDSRLLAATGEGVEKEELRAWNGWWNENIVQLVELSMRQKDTLTVLLTGRSESGFVGLIKKMLSSKNLDFDIISLKPIVGPNNERFSNTMNFKKSFLECLVETYKKAESIRVYEDRVKHVKAFREFFVEYNLAQINKPTRGTIAAEIIQVADRLTQLDPIIEIAEVQRVINDHNAAIKQSKSGKLLQIKKVVSYTGYLIGNDDTQKLLTLANIPSNIPDSDFKFLANNVLITPRPASDDILEKVGGIGNKVTWEVKGTSVYENKIWAACIRPVPDTKRYYTDNPTPTVVLAFRRGVRLTDAGKIQNWQPVPIDKQFVFNSVVGENTLLQIVEQHAWQDEPESLVLKKKNKRCHASINHSPPRERTHHNNQTPNSKVGYQQNHGPARSGRGSSRAGTLRGYRNGGNNRASRGRGRGGGPTYVYRSLDDVDKNNINTGYNASVAYEDVPQLQKKYPLPQKMVQQQFQKFQEQVLGKSKSNSDKGNSELQYS